jgi:hypothetical protein
MAPKISEKGKNVVYHHFKDEISIMECTRDMLLSLRTTFLNKKIGVSKKKSSYRASSLEKKTGAQLSFVITDFL